MKLEVVRDKIINPLMPNRKFGIVSYASPDCGGKDEDEYGYIYSCPICGREFDTDIWHLNPNYCQDCGQEIKWDK